MVKGARVIGDSTSETATAEIGDLCEMLQSLVTEVGHLASKVSSLENLDHVFMELKQQLMGENGRNTIPLVHEETQDHERGTQNRREGDRSPNFGNNSPFHVASNFQQSHFTRWMDFLKFSGDDLRSWLLKIEKFFSMENIVADEKVDIASLQLEGEAIQLHISFMRYRQNLQTISWKEYVGALVERSLILPHFPKCTKMQEAYQNAMRQPAAAQSQMNARRIADQKNSNNKPLFLHLVTGYHSKMELHILIDTGSSHNFIDLELVKKLGCEVRSIKPEIVAATNGSCGVVLGVQWLLTLDDIKLNFRNLIMEVFFKGGKHLLRGSDCQVLTLGAGKLAKHSGMQSQLFMIQILSEFAAFFEEPVNL
ncbi:hypothetical protein BC332_20523 [Capsicum chinense]|nr:hypothetical protein BC332_20523 [Capsicum chinense]